MTKKTAHWFDLKVRIFKNVFFFISSAPCANHFPYVEGYLV